MKFHVSRMQAAGIVLAALLALPAYAQQHPVPAAVAQLARAISAELVMRCPLAEADDAGAFESCRAALDEPGVLRTALPDRLLWGRAGSGAQAGLDQASYTQLAPELWARLYAPLFMFNGNHRVEWVAAENQFVIRLEAAFRNQLAPGQFPYPLWHDEAAWSAWQNTNGVLLWLQPQTGRIHVAQFTDQASTPSLQPVQPVARSFDGQWLWTDGAGRTQPAVTQFEGQVRGENPYRGALDRHYRDLALQMRESQCSTCHVPGGQGRRQVVLSSPVHAAGEIERVIRLAREPAPAGLPAHALNPADRQWLLQSAEAFRDTVRAARDWEADAARREHGAAGQPPERPVTLRRGTTLGLRP